MQHSSAVHDLRDGDLLTRKRKKKFRIGQHVQSVYDASHTFIIDKSRIPDRIFHEKGSNRWWTKNELQAIGEPENPDTSLRLNGKGKMRAGHL